MIKNSRTYNVVINTLFGIFSAIIIIGLNFIVRYFLVKILGEEINGIQSLFQNILNILLLMEVGISTSILIHLYSPIKHEEHEKIRLIMKFYKKLYINLSFIFTFVALVFSFFFLDKIITTNLSMRIVRLYFILFILTSSINYFTYYKQTILYAEQKNRIIVIINTIAQLLFRPISIILIYLYKNYFILLLMLVLERLIVNIICMKYVNKNYPYLNKKIEGELEEEDKIKIFNTAKPIFLNNVSASLQKSSSSILVSIISKNIALVGYLGAYQLIISAIEMLFSQFGAAFTSSFGNLYVEKNKEKMYQVYLKINFILNNITIFISTSFLFSIQNFIIIVFGKNFILDYSTVLLLSLNLVLYLVNIPVISIQNATGLHKKDNKLMLLQAIVSISLGYLLGKTYGINGIFIANLFSVLIFTIGYKGFIINKEIFGNTLKKYAEYIIKELLKILIIIVFIAILNSFLIMELSILNLIYRIFIVININILYLFTTNFKNPFFLEMIEKMKKSGGEK